MLRHIAVADAYGAGFEFSSRKKIQAHNSLTYYSAHDLFDVPGKYTDDTQMAIALAELIVSKKPWTPQTLASSFVSTYQRDPRPGYSKRFQALLEKCANGSDLLESIKPDSTRNGAAMRSPVIAHLGDEDKIRSHAELQARITHNTPIGVQSSQSVALAAHLGLSGSGTVQDIPDYLHSHGLDVWNYAWQTESTVQAYDACSAAFTCVLNCRQLSTLLKECIALGGDTDTVASIAIGIAVCFPEYEDDIPAELINSLDEPNYGVTFLNDLSKQLNETLPNST